MSRIDNEMRESIQKIVHIPFHFSLHGDVKSQ